MIEQEVLPPNHYRITVDTTEKPIYADLKATYQYVCDLWDESKYTLELHESLRELTPPTGEVMIFLKKFDDYITSKKAIEWADEHNCRLAFPWEREAFSKANPDLQRKFWIADLGSFVVQGDRNFGRNFPVLCNQVGDRDLGNWSGREWDKRGRFLFVCKPTVVPSGSFLDRITVPNLSVGELYEFAHMGLFAHLSPTRWDAADEGGKTYEVMIWAPGRFVTTDEVRKHFPEGFTGNTAAFIAWATEKNPMGWHVSIPEHDRLFLIGDRLCAPDFHRDGLSRFFSMYDVGHRWSDRCRFVAFRKVI
jgi:hypothetical protein